MVYVCTIARQWLRNSCWRLSGRVLILLRMHLYHSGPLQWPKSYIHRCRTQQCELRFRRLVFWQPLFAYMRRTEMMWNAIETQRKDILEMTVARAKVKQSESKYNQSWYLLVKDEVRLRSRQLFYRSSNRLKSQREQPVAWAELRRILVRIERNVTGNYTVRLHNKVAASNAFFRTSTTYSPSAPCITIPPLERCPTLSCSLVEPFPVTSKRRMTRSYLTVTVPRCFLPSRSASREDSC